MRAHLDKFELGDRVAFRSDGRTVEGVVIRVNRKTLTVKTPDSRWKVHPNFVSKVAQPGGLVLKTIEEIMGDGAR